MGIFQKGQGATEYLVLLAVVLIIALVSIALLGFFPGLATDARITQSNSYWRGEARPFAILEHTVGTSGNATLIVQNYDASGTLTVTNLTVGAGSNGTSMSFAPGEIRTVSVANVVSSPSAGQVYDLAVTFSYNTSNGVASKQYGSKNIIGKVS
ncbi:MAG: hypothetical protein QW568_00650 [Candidatus Anstonellaceae archaeon]